MVRAGLVLAALGVALFFVDDLAAEEAGIGLICVGAGVALTAAVRRSILADVEDARRSKTAAAAAILAMPHTAVFGLAGIGLIAFGLLVLAVAFRAV